MEKVAGRKNSSTLTKGGKDDPKHDWRENKYWGERKWGGQDGDSTSVSRL